MISTMIKSRQVITRFLAPGSRVALLPPHLRRGMVQADSSRGQEAETGREFHLDRRLAILDFHRFLLGFPTEVPGHNLFPNKSAWIGRVLAPVWLPSPTTAQRLAWSRPDTYTEGHRRTMRFSCACLTPRPAGPIRTALLISSSMSAWSGDVATTASPFLDLRPSAASRS